MRATGIKLTTFTVFTIAITFGLASIIGNLTPFQNTYAVKAEFSDATGVLVGDLVKIAGVNVGKVTGFEVKDGTAIVTLQIDREVDLPKNVEADLVFRNLLGQRTLNLVRPENPVGKMEEGDIIPVDRTSPALDVTVVFNNLRPLIQSTDPEEINTVARAIVEVFKGAEDDFAGTLGNVGEITKTLAARDQRLGRLVTDLNKLTQVLNRNSGSVRTGVGEFTEFMESLAEITPTIERTVDQLDAASRKFGGLIARNRSNLDQELQDLATVLGVVDNNLRSLSRVSRNLKEVLLATARSQSYGKWWTLYVVNFCLEDHGEPAPVEELECRR